MVDFNLAGLAASYFAALPYAGVHLLKAVLLSLVLVPAAAWAASKKIGVSASAVLSKSH